MEAYHSDELEPSSASLAQSDALERVIVIIIRFWICFHYHRNRFLGNWAPEQFPEEKQSRLPKIVLKVNRVWLMWKAPEYS